MTKKINEKEIQIYTQKAEIEIKDNTTLTTAVSLLSELNKRLDAVVEDRERITKPINTSLKEIRAKYKPLENLLEGAILSLRKKMSDYATQIEKEKQAIADRIAKGKGNLKLETAVSKMEAIAIPNSVKTSSGSLQFRPKQTLKITDPTAIPREYLTPDEDKILEALKQGLVVAGAEIEVIQIPYNSRN